jgi:hypothetical protein
MTVLVHYYNRQSLANQVNGIPTCMRDGLSQRQLGFNQPVHVLLSLQAVWNYNNLV